jgi:type IX secretion system PorP/SprF family membrane protein
MKIFRWVVIVFLFPQLLHAQDIHFSQFYSSPLTLNAANTGNYEGDYRIMNTYRSQWAKIDPGYLTNALGFDKQFFIGNNKLSAGFLFVYDRSGVNYLKSNQLNLSVAYHKEIGNHHLHAGLKGAWVFRAIDRSKISYPDQFNNSTGLFDPSLTTAERLLDDKHSYTDFGAGIGWNATFGKHMPEIGFSLFHLNKPNDGFYNIKSKMAMRKCLTVGDQWEVSDNIKLKPRFMFMEQVKANDFIFGATVARKLNYTDSKFTELNFGLYVRSSFSSQSDAIVPVLGVKYSLFDIGISYDINISNLEVATDKRGGFEISIIYTALSTRLFKIKIPCERY